VTSASPLTEPGAAIGLAATRARRRSRAAGNAIPVLTVLLGLVALWYVGAVLLNVPVQRDAFARAGTEYTALDLVRATLSHDRPVLPAPHQVAAEIWKTTALLPPTSKRSLLYHAWVTLSSTLLGFLMGTLIGVTLAVLIVHSRTLERSLMPWLVASQTIPILAIAPMIIVVLAAIGLKGLVPKAIISTYLSFFPVAVGMVTGLTSPDRIHLDLMRTYHASPVQVLLKLRLPASLPFLFTSMKVAVAAALVGAIVGELPTGAVF